MPDSNHGASEDAPSSEGSWTSEKRDRWDLGHDVRVPQNETKIFTTDTCTLEQNVSRVEQTLPHSTSARHDASTFLPRRARRARLFSSLAVHRGMSCAAAASKAARFFRTASAPPPATRRRGTTYGFSTTRFKRFCASISFCRASSFCRSSLRRASFSCLRQPSSSRARLTSSSVLYCGTSLRRASSAARSASISSASCGKRQFGMSVRVIPVRQ